MSEGTRAGAVGRPKGSTSEATRQRLLSAARAEFCALGFEGASLRRITQVAGVSLPTLYHHFESKVGLFASAYRAADAVVLDELSAAVAQEPSFAGRLTAMVEVARRLHATDPTVAAMLAIGQIERARSAEVSHSPGAAGAAIPELLRRVVSDAVEHGELADGVDPNAVADLIAATTLGVVLHATVVDPAENDGCDGLFDAWRALMSGHLLA